MDVAHNPPVKRPDDDDKGEKRDIKPPVKTLNRVPRACNACRKQKMRCEGADNPPCKRCRNTNLECLFEKPSREATLTGEAGLERIRSLEAHVAEIRNTQATISNTLSELVMHLRGGSIAARSPSVYPQNYHQPSPSMSSPSMSTPTATHQHASDIHSLPGGGPNVYSHPQGMIPHRQSQPPSAPYPGPSGHGQGQPMNSQEWHPPLLPPGHANNGQAQHPQAYNSQQQSQAPVLPPFSTISSIGGSGSQSNVSSVRYQNQNQERPLSRHQVGFKRQAPGSSNVTSADSSDMEDEDNGDLPASGLLAPWEVLRGLADVAIERAAKENGGSSGPQSRARTPSPDRQSRPSKRRKLRHRLHRSLTFPDVVTKGIIDENEARELFKIFYHGCSTFLPVFDSQTDTFDALHERSPFAVDCICMVAARTRDGGAQPSEKYIKILEEVQAISCATLFAPVMRIEAVQAMILVSGWSDNGWLSGGHAVRMAFELSLHKAWPRLHRRMKAGKIDVNEDRELIVASRTWFCLYLFEHQLSYGTGRPAVLKDDDSIRDCRLMLQHPLAIEDDMRLVSTVELMAIRERVNNDMTMEGPVREQDFERLRLADEEFNEWYKTWDRWFSQKYEDAAFYRQSLQIQHVHAQLFHNASALRGINGPEDVQNISRPHRELAIRSINIARQGLDITVMSPSYREGMRYAVHYTHATATFAASFLLRLARLFPHDCNIHDIRGQVERLASLMSEVPGKRYAITLQLMLKRSQKRKAGSQSRSPKASREAHRPFSMVVDASGESKSILSPTNHHPQRPPYESAYSGHSESSHNMHMGTPTVPQGGHPHAQNAHMHAQLQYPYTADQAEHIWRGFEATSNEQLPVWISDQSLGGNSFTQNGMDAFLLPTDYMPPTPQICIADCSPYSTLLLSLAHMDSKRKFLSRAPLTKTVQDSPFRTFLQRRKAPIKPIVGHINDVETRRRFILVLAKALLTFGAPSHRIESQLGLASEVLEAEAEFVHIPAIVIVTIRNDALKTTRTHFVRSCGRIALSPLQEVHRVYRDVLHDRISAEEGTKALKIILRTPPMYTPGIRCIFAFICGAIICVLSFGGSFFDLWISGLCAALLKYLGSNTANKSTVYANVYEISVTILVAFVARGLSSIPPGGWFCYSAISSAGVVLILPGFTILMSALELMSRNIFCGSVRIVYAIIYTLFLGFGLTIGSDLYLVFDRRASRLFHEGATTNVYLHGAFSMVNGTRPFLPIKGTLSHESVSELKHIFKGCKRNPSWPRIFQPFPWWAVFIFVPLYSLFSSLSNLQSYKRWPQLFIMVAFSCGAFTANKAVSMLLVGRVDISSAAGALSIGLLGNVYSRIIRGTAFTSMVTGVLFLVPSGIAQGGSLSQNFKSSAEQYSSGFSLALRMISVASGVTVGLFVSQVVVYFFGVRKKGGAGAHFAF